MAKAKIQRATQKGKSWQIKVKNPNTGRMETHSGGQKGVRTGKSRKPEDRESFRKRHGAITSIAKYVNDKLWKDKKIGDTVNIPNKFFKK